MSGRRVIAALLAMMLGAAVISVLPGAVPASADGAPPDSAVTKSGTGAFANLEVTVSQTTNLINQVVSVSWKGGVPTLPATGAFGANYLQIMQCWGDDQSNGPDRTQCQFGGVAGTLGSQNGHWVASRQISYPFVDKMEKLSGSVPFRPAGSDTSTTQINQYFDSQITNEIPLARNHGDGTGQVFFEVETVRQSAGLGCGEPVTTGAVTAPRKCWLVIVPRGTKEVDGSTRSGLSNTDRIDSSPLSQSNWDNRIYFPLDFLPVTQSCPIGAAERRVIGHELAVDAVSRWQPALCGAGGANFSYTQLPDDVVRNQVLAGGSPSLALITNPIPPDQAPAGQPLVYAPVGLSGLAIAFNIERQPALDAPPADLQRDGQRFLSMNLTPRLVAKLLTQSYQGAVVGVHDYLKKNPAGLTVDPEFLAINPDYAGFSFGVVTPDALVQLGGSDLTLLLWSWVKADPDASAFLAGRPDESGMVVNPNNINLPLPESTFPRNEQTCIDSDLGNGVTGQTCTMDVHPFTTDMHDSGRSASRGDSQGRRPEADGQTAVPKKLDRQLPGHQALLAVVDAATAARYSLPTAGLLNAAHQFVTPTTESLLAGEKAMKPSGVPGVLTSDPGAPDKAAYPLTALSYAVTSPATLDAPAGKDYAAFLRYAAGPGQKPGVAPGQLPFGMVPLPDPLRAQAIAAAATIEAQAGKIPPSSPTPRAPTNPGIVRGTTAGDAAGSPGGASAAAGSGTAATDSGGGVNAPRTGVATPSGPATNAPSVAQQPVARVRRTPALPAPAVGALLLTILISGALAATSSPVLQSPALRRLGAAVRRLLRRGVTPTEQ